MIFQSLRNPYGMVVDQNPELGVTEVRTSDIIAKELKNFGYEVITGIGNAESVS